MEIDPKDIIISRYDVNSRAGGWSLNRVYGIRIDHRPSGLWADCSEDRSEHRNRVTAMARLQAKVNEWELQGSPMPGVDVRGGAPNPHGVDLVRLRKNFDEGILSCKINLIQALDYAIELERALGGLPKLPADEQPPKKES